MIKNTSSVKVDILVTIIFFINKSTKSPLRAFMVNEVIMYLVPRFLGLNIPYKNKNR